MLLAIPHHLSTKKDNKNLLEDAIALGKATDVEAHYFTESLYAKKPLSRLRKGNHLYILAHGTYEPGLVAGKLPKELLDMLFGLGFNSRMEAITIHFFSCFSGMRAKDGGASFAENFHRLLLKEHISDTWHSGHTLCGDAEPVVLAPQGRFIIETCASMGAKAFVRLSDGKLIPQTSRFGWEISAYRSPVSLVPKKLDLAPASVFFSNSGGSSAASRFGISTDSSSMLRGL